ncbi:hypothetical protein H2204_000257 [Knufia peltigerae]|uniref:Uncharacterized protein n=1 Tax=Knufia peltigerae TaxID=1002370 RepID=A0AA38YFK5_9EURO|nr:hypothetical protein H2204_000257 [Knufia peltigerae]
MSIPQDPTADCVLALQMAGPTSSDIICTITGANLGVEEGKRTVILSNGSTVSSNSTICINKFNEAGINSIFSGAVDLLAALKAGNLYRREMAGEQVVPSCVSFLVPADVGSDVTMELTLGRELGEQLALKLYGRR